MRTDSFSLTLRATPRDAADGSAETALRACIREGVSGRRVRAVDRRKKRLRARARISGADYPVMIGVTNRALAGLKLRARRVKSRKSALITDLNRSRNHAPAILWVVIGAIRYNK
ncbi:hypothetical protein PHYPO_G00163390 [Pangasianodon hypophthalmus]|uniref:Uncharacterized protein n=1 Tax=Pangasianodon hypophthalmus TaxID=310915 RepID=A0A5N5JUH5_PANHP|nr:hypothetical protein PHYPO_G00163390 [Pangasianodon hypophthalmus]